MNNTFGLNDLLYVSNSTLSINSGEMQNISGGNLSIYNIYKSSFVLFQAKILNILTSLIYSSYSSIEINNISIVNSMSNLLTNDFLIKFQYNVSFTISYSNFEDLNNCCKYVIYTL